MFRRNLANKIENKYLWSRTFDVSRNSAELSIYNIAIVVQCIALPVDLFPRVENGSLSIVWWIKYQCLISLLPIQFTSLQLITITFRSGKQIIMASSTVHNLSHGWLDILIRWLLVASFNQTFIIFPTTSPTSKTSKLKITLGWSWYSNHVEWNSFKWCHNADSWTWRSSLIGINLCGIRWKVNDYTPAKASA